MGHAHINTNVHGILIGVVVVRITLVNETITNQNQVHTFHIHTHITLGGTLTIHLLSGVVVATTQTKAIII